jgi:hypothetical protein
MLLLPSTLMTMLPPDDSSCSIITSTRNNVDFEPVNVTSFSELCSIFVYVRALENLDCLLSVRLFCRFPGSFTGKYFGQGQRGVQLITFLDKVYIHIIILLPLELYYYKSMNYVS